MTIRGKFPVPQLLAVVVVCCLMGICAIGETTEEGVEFFESRIRPVLAQECYECHTSAGKKKGGLALDHRQALLAGGDTGKAIVVGDPANSLLIKVLHHEIDDLKMPKASAKLDDSVIADFEKWIRMGAPDPRDTPATREQIKAETSWDAVLLRRKTAWSFQPIKTNTLASLPEIKDAKHLVDRFIRAKLSAAVLTPARQADSRVLIRRLSYALRGLPPSPNEISAFLSDPDGRAYANLVSTFLGSPSYGERWARHWMDWMRYADSHGSEGDPMIPYAWKYRDYLIRAVNADVPYDQMVREQLAGDLLKRPRINQELGLNESALGIGHLRMVFHGFAPTDPMEEQVRFTDDQIGVVSKAFLGLTVSCARCHNHKFDPISQKDFYGWYGIFASCPPASIAVDAPSDREDEIRRKMAEQKKGIKSALASSWLHDADQLVQRLSQPDERWKKKIADAKESSALLFPFYMLNQITASNSMATNALAIWRKQIEETESKAALVPVKRWSLTNSTELKEWHHDGPSVADISPAASFSIRTEGDTVIAGIYPSGVYSHLVSSKDRGVMLSPRFVLDAKYDVWLHVLGTGGSVARYVVQNYPRDGSIYPVTRLSEGKWQWVKFGLDYWQGDRIHLEVTTAADQPVLADVNAARSSFGLREVILTKSGEPGPSETWEFARPVLEAIEKSSEIRMKPGESEVVRLAKAYAKAVRTTVQEWLRGTLTDAGALFLDESIRAGLLANLLADLPETKPLITIYRELEGTLRIPARAPGVMETAPINQPLLVRGEHKQPAEAVPRRFLDAIDNTPYPAVGSGRFELAESILRKDNPLAARVIVNRVWLHLFGKGLVATPDNFGKLGQPPSHPELLDYLANWFVENGYSIKRLITFLVASETWKQSSEPPPGASEIDPANLLLSHFNVHRLEAEAVRDGLLSVAGDLKCEERYGPPILAATPRRSVYLRVKRNDLDPFLSAFDAPVPATTKGQRDVTNVPGQSLTLLNDPAVLDLAQHWADRLDKNPTLTNASSRIETMFIEAFGRTPLASEIERAQQFVNWTETQRNEAGKERSRLEVSVSNAAARLKAISSAASQRILAQRKEAGAASSSPLPKPVSAWNFKEGLQDQAGQLHGKAFGAARRENGVLVLDGQSSYVATEVIGQTLKAKTLEAWVQLDTLDQRGGAVISIQNTSGHVFDAIVIGENEIRHWMAGSESYKRTQAFDGPPEMEAVAKIVHTAVVYSEDGTITLYRNGQLYGKAYKSSGPIVFEAGKSQILFGNRHGDGSGNRCLAGKIHQARLYNYALSADEIQASADGNQNLVSEREMLNAMTQSEKTEFDRLQNELSTNSGHLKTLYQTRGLGSKWADLGHALFNMKEFIYIR